jgi:hypothetical protein
LISDANYKPLINSSDRNGWAIFEKNPWMKSISPYRQAN